MRKLNVFEYGVGVLKPCDFLYVNTSEIKRIWKENKMKELTCLPLVVTFRFLRAALSMIGYYICLPFAFIFKYCEDLHLY